MLLERLSTHRNIPVQLQPGHESRCETEALPDLGKGATEEVEAEYEGVRQKGAIREFVDVAEDEEFDLITALSSKFLCGIIVRVDEEGCDGT